MCRYVWIRHVLFVRSGPLLFSASASPGHRLLSRHSLKSDVVYRKRCWQRLGTGRHRNASCSSRRAVGSHFSRILLSRWSRCEHLFDHLGKLQAPTLRACCCPGRLPISPMCFVSPFFSSLVIEESMGNWKNVVLFCASCRCSSGEEKSLH